LGIIIPTDFNIFQRGRYTSRNESNRISAASPWIADLGLAACELPSSEWPKVVLGAAGPNGTQKAGAHWD